MMKDANKNRLNAKHSTIRPMKKSHPMKKRRTQFSKLTLMVFILSGISCKNLPPDHKSSTQQLTESTQTELPPLKTLSDIPIGVAVALSDFPGSIVTNNVQKDLVIKHFSSLTAENHMKMGLIQPQKDKFQWEHADWLYNFAEKHQMQVHGHALVWHRQTPTWMEEFQGNTSDWEKILKDHVITVAKRYSGRTHSWDVVNEAISDQSGMIRPTIFQKNIPDYIHKSFLWADSADPQADLYYNDYHFVDYPNKWNGILNLIDDLQNKQSPIDGVGFQLHINDHWPNLSHIEQAFKAIVDRELKVRISELDVGMNSPWAYQSPRTTFTANMAKQQAQLYYAVVKLYFKVVPPKLRGGITLWGVSDQYSWIPHWYKNDLNKPRPDWPLLFDEHYQAKPAAHSFSEALLLEKSKNH